MRRHLIGVISLVLLTVGVYLYFWPPSGNTWVALCGASLRVGAVLATVWLAWPEITQLPVWLYGAFGVGLLVVLISPKLIVFVLPTLAVLWIVRPRSSKK